MSKLKHEWIHERRGWFIFSRNVVVCKHCGVTQGQFLDYLTMFRNGGLPDNYDRCENRKVEREYDRDYEPHE